MKNRFLIGVGLWFAMVCPVCMCATTSCGGEVSDGPGERGERKVAEIVFVDYDVICPLTKKSIDAGWKTLQTAVGTRRVTVRRIHRDRSQNLAAKYLKLRETGLAPAIYFLDRRHELVEFLSGDVTVEEISEVLDRTW